MRSIFSVNSSRREFAKAKYLTLRVLGYEIPVDIN